MNLIDYVLVHKDDHSHMKFNVKELEAQIANLSESPDCNHPRQLRAIALDVRKLEDRLKQLEQENDALRADLLLWTEKEVKL